MLQCCNGAEFHCTVVIATPISVLSRLQVCLHQFMLTCIRSFFSPKTAAFAKAYPTLGSADSFNLFVSASDLLLSRPRGKPAKDGSMLEMFHALATAEGHGIAKQRKADGGAMILDLSTGAPQIRKAEIQLTMLFNANGVPPVSVEPRGLAAVPGSVRRSVLNSGGSSKQPDGTMGVAGTLDRPQRTVSSTSSV